MYPELDHEKNIWYDNGVKKNDLSELNDIVEMYCLPQYLHSSSYSSAQALLLRQDGSIAVWSKVHHLDDNRTNELSSAEQEVTTPNSSYAKRLMDSTDPNFSPIKKICVARLGGWVMLREDGRIAILDDTHSPHRRLAISSLESTW